MVSGVLVEVPFLLSSLSLWIWTLEFDQKFKSGEAQSYISGFLNSGPYNFLIILISSFVVLC